MLCIGKGASAYINSRPAAIFPRQIDMTYKSAGDLFRFGNRLVHRPEHRVDKHLAKLRILKVVRMSQ